MAISGSLRPETGLAFRSEDERQVYLAEHSGSLTPWKKEILVGSLWKMDRQW